MRDTSMRGDNTSIFISIDVFETFYSDIMEFNGNCKHRALFTTIRDYGVSFGVKRVRLG